MSSQLAPLPRSRDRPWPATLHRCFSSRRVSLQQRRLDLEQGRRAALERRTVGECWCLSTSAAENSVYKRILLQSCMGTRGNFPRGDRGRKRSIFQHPQTARAKIVRYFHKNSTWRHQFKILGARHTALGCPPGHLCTDVAVMDMKSDDVRKI